MEFRWKTWELTGLSTPGRTTTSALISKDFKKANYLANLGMNHILSLNDKSFIKTSVNYSGTGADDDIFETDTLRTYNIGGEPCKRIHFSQNAYGSKQDCEVSSQGCNYL